MLLRNTNAQKVFDPKEEFLLKRADRRFEIMREMAIAYIRKCGHAPNNEEIKRIGEAANMLIFENNRMYQIDMVVEDIHSLGT